MPSTFRAQKKQNSFSWRNSGCHLSPPDSKHRRHVRCYHDYIFLIIIIIIIGLITIIYYFYSDHYCFCYYHYYAWNMNNAFIVRPI